MNRILHLIIILLFLFQEQAKASQVMGGEITYRHLGGLKYEVNFKFYRNCTGVSVDTMHAEMRGSAKIKVLSLTRVSIRDVSNYCKQNSNPCGKANTNGAGLGIEEHLFRDTVDFDKADSAFKTYCKIEFGFGQCCRSTGTVIGSGKSFWVTSYLDFCNAQNNSSPIITSIPNNIICCNQPLFYSLQAIDTIDNDSISYSYVEPLESWGKSIPYPTYPKPWITTTAGVYLDSEMGNLILTPTNCSELPVVAFLISEWRKDSTGQYKIIGQVRRDIQYVVQSCSGNNPSEIYGPYKQDVCAGAKICWTIASDDKQYKSNPLDTVSLTWNNGIKGATFKIIDTTARLQKAQFCWTPKESDASDLPYTFTVTARDNNCPSNGITIKSYSVKVKKIAKTTITKKHIKNGLYELKSEIEKGFKGTAQYSWEISDSAMNPLSDTVFYFHPGGNLKSSRPLDSVQFYKGGTYIIHHRINNPPFSCPTDYFDTLKVDPVTPILQISPKILQEKWVCKNTVDTIFPVLKNAKNKVKYRWSSSPADTLPYLIVNIKQDVTYRVDVYDGAGYHRFAEWSFYVYQEPVLKMGKDILACVGDSVSLGTSASNFTGTVFWKWFFDGKQISTNPKIKVINPGTYILEIYDSNQCVSKFDTTEVSNMPVSVFAGSNREICDGDTVMLKATGLDTNGGKKGEYYWYINTLTTKAADTGSTIPYKLKVDSTMIVKLVQTKGTLTCSDLDTVAVSFRKLPEVVLGKGTICQNENELDLHTVILNPSNSHKGIVSWQITKTLRKPNGSDNTITDLVYDKDNSSNDLYYLNVDDSQIDLAGKFIDSLKLSLIYRDEFGCENTSSNDASIIIRSNIEVTFASNELKRCYGDSMKYISNDYGVNYYGGRWFTINDSSNYLTWPQGNIVQISEKLGTKSLNLKGGKYLMRYILENNNCYSSKNAVLSIIPYSSIVWSQSDRGDSIVLSDKSSAERREWYINSKKMSETNTLLISKDDAKFKIIVLKVFNANCETDSTLKPEVLIGINKINLSSFLISPNPVRNDLLIKTSFNKPYRIEIVNSLGQMVLTKSFNQNQETISVSGLSDGIYSVILKTGNDILVQKFVKTSD